MKKLTILTLVFLMVGLVSAVPGDWYGSISINNSAAPNGTVLEVYSNNTLLTNTTTPTTDGGYSMFGSGFYLVVFEANNNASLDFKVCGISANNTTVFTGSTHPLNLSLDLQPDGTFGCECDSVCNGGHCVNPLEIGVCNNANFYCDDDGTCEETYGEDSSNCGDCSSTSTSSSSGGGSSGSIIIQDENVVENITSKDVVNDSLTTTISDVNDSVELVVNNDTSVNETVVEETTPVVNNWVPKSGDVSEVVSLTNGEGTTVDVNNEDIPVISVTLNANGDAQDLNVEVKSFTSNPGVNTPSDEVYQYLQINLEDQTSLENANIKFKVSKEYLASNNLNQDGVMLQRNHDGIWQQLSTSKVSETDDYVVYSSLTPGFSYFAITVASQSATGVTGRFIQGITNSGAGLGIAVMVLVILLGLLGYMFYRRLN